MVRRILFIGLTVFLVSSCTDDYGNRVVGGDLTIYYDFEKDGELAENLALYWKNNDLLTGKPQDLKLTRGKKGHVLYLIANLPEKAKEPSIEKLGALHQLQNSLEDSIFTSKGVEIVVCNDQFEPIFNINQ